MRPIFRSSLLATVFAAALTAGCTDWPTSPTSDAGLSPSEASRALLNTSYNVTTLQRSTPLAAPITVSKNIGVLGGVISIPGAGLTVTIPPLALTNTTTISVTALAGSAVAYEFAPHGLTFVAPLVAVQDLSKTKTSGLNLSLFSAGYFLKASDIDSRTGTAKVAELLSIKATLAPMAAVWTIPHFSGYLVATGRSGE
jgi:hypothetical protein